MVGRGLRKVVVYRCFGDFGVSGLGFRVMTGIRVVGHPRLHGV